MYRIIGTILAQNIKSYSIDSGLDSGLKPTTGQKNNMVAIKKRLLLTAIKSMVSALLIYWVLQGTNLTEIFKAMRSAHLPLLVLAFSLHFLIYYVSAHRWRLLLSVQGVNASVPFLIGSWIVCSFFNNLLPSIIGGDVIRAYDSWRLGTSKAGALAVIFVDRLLGMLALMLFALGALLVSKKMTPPLSFTSFYVLLGIIAGLLSICCILIFSHQVSTLVTKIRVPFSKKLNHALHQIFSEFQLLANWKHPLPKTLGLSLLLHANSIIHFYIISIALGLSVPFHTFFLIIPLAIIAMMIPASINGIGIRENIFVFFFCPFGISKPEAIAFAWLAYLILLSHGLLGGIIYALRK